MHPDARPHICTASLPGALPWTTVRSMRSRFLANHRTLLSLPGEGLRSLLSVVVKSGPEVHEAPSSVRARRNQKLNIYVASPAKL